MNNDDDNDDKLARGLNTRNAGSYIIVKIKGSIFPFIQVLSLSFCLFYLFIIPLYTSDMSKLERLSDRFLRVGRHPFKMCIKSNQNDEKRTEFDDLDVHDTQTCCCCHSDSPIYAKLWPLIFFFSALTDFPMPLPKGKKPGQHRDWGWVPVLIVTGILVFVYYGYLHSIVCKSHCSLKNLDDSLDLFSGFAEAIGPSSTGHWISSPF